MSDANNISFERYLQQGKPRQPSTVKAYLKAVRAFQGWLSQTGLAAGGVEAADITNYLEARKAALSYRNSVLAALRVWYDYLGEVGQVRHNPARELKRSVSRPKPEGGDILGADEIQQLCEAVVQHSRSFEQARNLALLSLLVDAALSTQEVCRLERNDVDEGEDPCILRVRGVKGKARSVVLGAETDRALRGWLNERRTISEHVEGLYQQPDFAETLDLPPDVMPPAGRPPRKPLWQIPANRKKGWPLTDQGLRFMLKHFAKLAGIDKNVTPRLLRKTFA